MNKTILNPLTLVNNDLVSQSSMVNTQVGVCPTCHNTMATSTLSDGERVYYCHADRVTLPLSNNGVSNV